MYVHWESHQTLKKKVFMYDAETQSAAGTTLDVSSVIETII